MSIKDFFVNFKQSKKYKTVFVISLFVAAFILAGAVAAKRYSNRSQTSLVKPGTKVKVAEQLVTCPLDGKSYTKDKATRHPLAVVIENFPDARPQSGYSAASIIYEAITEGGITRTLAIFGPNDAPEVGPIRSARLFFMDWVKEYDAFFAHDGGNEDALANIGAYNIKDLKTAQKYFWRDNKGKNVAYEHTEYSATTKLYEYAKSLKFDTASSNFETLKFTVEKPITSGGKNVEIDFSKNPSYKVKWQYDAASNSYNRFLAGKAHSDRNGGEQIKAKNIIVQEVSRTLQPHGSYGDENWLFQTTGSGKVQIFNNGNETVGTWKKTSRDSRTKFYDSQGAQIEFVPGQTWYEIIAPDVSTVTVS